MCRPAAGAELAGPAALADAEPAEPAGAAVGADESPHPAIATTTARGTTRAKAARRNRETLCAVMGSFWVVMEIILRGLPILLDPDDPPARSGVAPTLARFTIVGIWQRADQTQHAATA